MGNTREELIAEFDSLNRQVDAERARALAFKILIKARYDEVERLILAPYAAEPPEKTFVERAGPHAVQISPCENVRRISSMTKLKNWFGIKTFLQYCKFNLADIDALVPKSEHGLFLVEGRTGKRHVFVVPAEVNFLAPTPERRAE